MANNSQTGATLSVSATSTQPTIRQPNSVTSTATVNIPAAFVTSCARHEEYPKKLVASREYGPTLLFLAQSRLKDQARYLNLFDPKGKTLVPFRTISRDGVVAQGKLIDEAKLSKWLGDAYTPDPNNPAKYSGAKADPQCGFIFLVTSGMTEPLKVTSKSLLRILSYFQVMPNYLDYLYIFGGRYGIDRERNFGGFRTEMDIAEPHTDLRMPALNRSGKRYQMCYNLKTVALKWTAEASSEAIITEGWKIRQAAIHHQFDVETFTQLWIMGDPCGSFKKLVGEQFHEQKDHSKRFGDFAQSFKSSLDTHLMCCRWATEEWRWHIHSLEEIVENLTRPFLMQEKPRVSWNGGALGGVQEYEEKANEAAMALRSNMETLKRLQNFYTNLVADGLPASSAAIAGPIVKQFVTKADELIYDLRMQTLRVEMLAKNVSDRKVILIQHLQGQVADRAETATNVMLQQAEKSGLEAIAVRIITVITLFYLPATFVATFFSTDVVKYQPNDDGTSSVPGTGESKSTLALERFLEVSIPLMAFTFTLAAGWWYYERYKRKRDLKSFDQYSEKV